MAFQHFARDLRITRLIRADESERRELPKKEKRAEREQEQPVRNAEAFQVSC